MEASRDERRGVGKDGERPAWAEEWEGKSSEWGEESSKDDVDDRWIGAAGAALVPVGRGGKGKGRWGTGGLWGNRHGA